MREPDLPTDPEYRTAHQLLEATPPHATEYVAVLERFATAWRHELRRSAAAGQGWGISGVWVDPERAAVDPG